MLEYDQLMEEWHYDVEQMKAQRDEARAVARHYYRWNRSALRYAMKGARAYLKGEGESED